MKLIMVFQPPRTTHFLKEEGGEWIEFVRGQSKIDRVHAIKFEDGSIWDTVYGWRHEVIG